jgi:hypothetical protein
VCECQTVCQTVCQSVTHSPCVCVLLTCRFVDVSGWFPMDFACQYRAPAPCQSGYLYYGPATAEGKDEFGMASCLRVFKPATSGVAHSTCEEPKGASGSTAPWVPSNSAVRAR